ncbi:MAG: hemolysin III family protein [Actinobacteria bacterium]|nr:hemolysin III family protein [Actinomycetota bacterium]
MTSLATATAPPVERPRLRGALHLAGFAVACFVGIAFLVTLDGMRLLAAGVFAGSAIAMLGASALYHRVTWTPAARLRMRRVDHAGIYVLIAGTYTPVGLLSLHGSLQEIVLAVVWAGAGAAILAKLWWVGSPKWLSAVFGIALGWVGVAAMPQLATTAGPTAVALLAAGGLAYTAGAIVYARRRPDPVPGVFGYHEVFHALTLVALSCQYVAIAFFVVRVG